MRIFLLICCLLLIGCAAKVTQPLPYTVLNTTPYDAQSCASISYEQSENGYSTGLALQAVDSVTGEALKTSGTWRTRYSGSGVGDDFTCVEGMNDTATRIAVSSPGHVPQSIVYEPVHGSLARLQLPMPRSGTVPSDCYAFLTQGRDPSEYPDIKQNADSIIANALDHAGITATTVTYSECSGGRGGYVKLNGTADGAPFTIYFRSGWCSSGGSDCGYALCLSSSSKELIAHSKNVVCPTLQSQSNSAGAVCEPQEQYNTTAQVRQDCMDGKLGVEQDGKYVLSFYESSNRCSSSVTIGNPDCMGS